MTRFFYWAWRWMWTATAVRSLPIAAVPGQVQVISSPGDLNGHASKPNKRTVNLIKFILNGGIGVFSDTNPWFDSTANFVAGSYQPTDTITWGEAYLEPGLAGITQVGDHPAYFYGAGSYTLSTTIQPDIFRADDRFWGDIEQLYGGLLVSEPEHSVSFNLSIGRQKFQLNQGFLFSQFAGSANALDRAASFSNPRVAYGQTVLANLNWGDVRLQGFFLQPDELPVADSETQYVEASLSFNNNHNLEAALTLILS